jgi:hypothetical protein
MGLRATPHRARPHRNGDATAQVEELGGEPAITSTATSAAKPVDVASNHVKTRAARSAPPSESPADPLCAKWRIYCCLRWRDFDASRVRDGYIWDWRALGHARRLATQAGTCSRHSIASTHSRSSCKQANETTRRSCWKEEVQDLTGESEQFLVLHVLLLHGPSLTRPPPASGETTAPSRMADARSAGARQQRAHLRLGSGCATSARSHTLLFAGGP